jgi:hypothetical protein
MKKIIFVLVVAATLLPLAHTGLFDVHDPTSIVRFYTLQQSLLDGQIPAIWTNLLNHGFGYPLFLYYAPIFSYMGALLKFIFPTYLLSLKLSLIFLTFLGSLGMYKLMRRYGSSVSLLASLSYTLLPYHASALYVRGSYAELTTMAILPWLLYFWSQTIITKKDIAITSICTSLFFLSHNSLPFIFIPFLIWWIVLNQKNNLKFTLFTILLSIAQIAWFIIPILTERKLVQVDSIALTTRLSDHFLTLSQLWHSPWGYGGSAPLNQIDGMSFMLGKSQLVLAIFTLIILTIYKKWDSKKIFYVILILLAAIGTTNLTAPLWSLIPSLSIVQFPWRLLAYASFALSAFASFSLLAVPIKYRFHASLFAVAFLLFFNIKFFAPEKYINYSDQDFLSQEKLDTTAVNKIPEYLPVTMPTFPTTSQSDGLTRTATKVFGTLNVSAPDQLTINTAYMPQWQLRINNIFTPIIATSEGYIQTKNDLAPGESKIELVWSRTPIEKIGLMISALSILVVIGLWLL